MRRALLSLALLLSTFVFDALVARSGAADTTETALVVAVDVSGSVDDTRYRLQMEGLAEALEDSIVVDAIVGSGGIEITLIAWADQARTLVDWRRLASKRDVATMAATIRTLPLQGGEFTCLGRMFRTLSDVVVPTIPTPVSHLVVDVSGDGIDNCTNPDLLREDRDSVLAMGATINGLPILVAGLNDTVGVGTFRAPGYGLSEMSRDPDHDQTTLDRWYRDHVVGGPGAFVLPAKGYGDFKNALRRKFVLEISQLSGRAPLR